MTDIICIRCQDLKPADQFKANSGRCNFCRAEANKLNVAHHRELTREIADNRAFTDLYRRWARI